MYRAGRDKKGQPLIESTVCPQRVISETDAAAVFEWWLYSSPNVDGRPSGPPEWPWKGGLSRQPAKLVSAVKLLRAEWEQWSAMQIREAQAKAPQQPRRHRGL